MAGSASASGHGLKLGLMVGMFAATVLVLAVAVGSLSQVSAPPSGDGAPAPAGPAPTPSDGAPPTDSLIGTLGVIAADTYLFADVSLSSDTAGLLTTGDRVDVICSVRGEPIELEDGTASDIWYGVLPLSTEGSDGYVPSVAVEVDASAVSAC